MHFQEKKDKAFKKGTILDVAKTIKTMVERQQNEEINALYDSGDYKLSKEYESLKVDPVKWHSWEPERRRKQIEKLRNYQPGIGDTFTKPKSSGRKKRNASI